jgi:Ser/Thr protein kinase RdoA (MazF antagonist)
MVRLVATYLRRMHDSGLWHRDMVTSNVLLTGAPGNRQVSLVDLNRARRLPYMPMVLRAIDLARMGWWERLPQLCAFYSVGCFSATRLWWLMYLYGRWRTWRWHMRRAFKPLRARWRI